MAPRKKSADEPKRRYRYPGLYSTSLVRQRCGKCKAEVYGGWHLGFQLQLDIWDLSQFGEVQSLLLKIPTYHVLDGDPVKRTAPAITRHPVPYVGKIRREHRCGLMPPSDMATAPIEAGVGDSECPF